MGREYNALGNRAHPRDPAIDFRFVDLDALGDRDRATNEPIRFVAIVDDFEIPRPNCTAGRCRSHPRSRNFQITNTSDELLRRRLHNVFRVLAKPEHHLYEEAIKLRHAVSSAWAARAAEGRWFPWPTTSAPLGSSRLKNVAWRQQGMLGFLGYHVGEMQQTPEAERWCILEYALECQLPPLNDRAYYLEWGKPLTSLRLQKLANTLAAFARNAKRRDAASWAKAIEDWEDDLLRLHERYYVNYFRFGWPATDPLH